MSGMGEWSEEKPLDLAELQRQLHSLFDEEGDDVEIAGSEEGRTGKEKAPDDQGSASPRGQWPGFTTARKVR